MGLVVLIAVLVVSATVNLVSQRTLRGQARALESFIKGMSLPLTDVALTMIPRRLFRTSVGALIGAVPASAFLVVSAVRESPSIDILFYCSIFLLLAAAGAAVGVAIACTTNIGPSRPELPRIARATRPRMTDYLSPAWIVTSIAICAAAIPVAVLALTRNTANSALNTFLVILIVVDLLTLALSPWLARRLLASPQPANDSLELAWDDALRAYGLRSVWFAPLALGIATILFAINLVYPGLSVLIVLTYFLCIVGFRFIPKLTRPGWRFQRRLWPITPQPVVGSYAE